MNENTPPAGMIEVSSERFQQTIMQLDVHPHPERNYTRWLLKGLKLIAWSDCGYVTVHGQKERLYALPEYVS